MAEKLVIMVTHGPDHPEHVTIPFVMAVAALASDVEVVIGLQADGVELAVKGRADTVAAEGFPPLAKLMADYQELGGNSCSAVPASSRARSTPRHSSSTTPRSSPRHASSPKSPPPPTPSSTRSTR